MIISKVEVSAMTSKRKGSARKEFIAVVGSRGQITIPKEVRDELQIRDGYIVKVAILRVLRPDEI